LSMYKDILGFPENSFLEKYESPFPKDNRLTLIIPETTTKFSKRDENQFKRMAEISAEITNEIPGNCAIFFPSYDLRNNVNRYFQDLSRKTAFIEESLMSKSEKAEFLENFKKYDSAVLLGAASGSFSEGIDLPGILKCVIVIGLPLSHPDLETKELIKYYDNKFSKGWDYGYIFPALNKTIQAAGRCIRSEHDRGVIVFLDERYSWDNYMKCFPIDWDLKITKLFMPRIREFFKK
jgi:DNA excision repair protein ERCC-2